jgi:hypothetical protein
MEAVTIGRLDHDGVDGRRRCRRLEQGMVVAAEIAAGSTEASAVRTSTASTRRRWPSQVTAAPQPRAVRPRTGDQQRSPPASVAVNSGSGGRACAP